LSNKNYLLEKSFIYISEQMQAGDLFFFGSFFFFVHGPGPMSKGRNPNRKLLTWHLPNFSSRTLSELCIPLW